MSFCNHSHRFAGVLVLVLCSFISQSIPVATVLMEMFASWEAPISMKVEWRCASMISGGQCVMTTGTAMMLLWSAGSWVMLTLDVSFFNLHSFGVTF